MRFITCPECRANFDNASAFISHICDPDAVRREGMRIDLLRMANRANRAPFVEWYVMPNIHDLVTFEEPRIGDKSEARRIYTAVRFLLETEPK